MPWDNPSQLRIDLASNLPQKLRQIVKYCPKTEPQTSEKMDFNTFVKKPYFYDGFEGNHLGWNIRHHPGIISRFHKNDDSDPCFAGQSQHFLKHIDFYFLFLNNWSFFRGQIPAGAFLAEGTYVPGFLTISILKLV